MICHLHIVHTAVRGWYNVMTNENTEITCHVSVEIVTHEPTITAMGIICFKCNQCDWIWYMGDICRYPDKPNYCPNCGAKVIQSAKI